MNSTPSIEDGERLELRYVAISGLLSGGWIGNPKKHEDEKIRQSIQQHGFKDPIKWEDVLNGGQGGIVEGNGRRGLCWNRWVWR